MKKVVYAMSSQLLLIIDDMMLNTTNGKLRHIVFLKVVHPGEVISMSNIATVIAEQPSMK